VGNKRNQRESSQKCYDATYTAETLRKHKGRLHRLQQGGLFRGNAKGKRYDLERLLLPRENASQKNDGLGVGRVLKWGKIPPRGKSGEAGAKVETLKVCGGLCPSKGSPKNAL